MPEQEMYEYETPEGMGDIFFVYVFNGTQNGVEVGDSFSQLNIAIQDGDFVCRAWAGAESLLNSSGPSNTFGTIQIYDDVMSIWFNLPVFVFTEFATGQSVIPEFRYRNNGFIKFDIANAFPWTSGVVPVNQLAFYGVRRSQGLVSDPAPSIYDYYDTQFSIPFSFQLQNFGSATDCGPPEQHIVPILDFDFELRRIEASKTNPPSGLHDFGGGS